MRYFLNKSYSKFPSVVKQNIHIDISCYVCPFLQIYRLDNEEVLPNFNLISQPSISSTAVYCYPIFSICRKIERSLFIFPFTFCNVSTVIVLAVFPIRSHSVLVYDCRRIIIDLVLLPSAILESPIDNISFNQLFNDANKT